MVTRGTSGRRRARHHQMIVAAAAVAGGALAARPTGLGAFDVGWCALFAGGLAYAGSATSRLVLLPAAGAAVMLADARLSLALGLGAVVIAAGNAVRSRFSVRWGAAAGGVLALALLTGSGPADEPWLDLLGTTAVTLAVLVGAHRQVSRRRRRQHWRVVGAAGGVVAVLALAGGAAALLARGAVDDGIDAFEAARTTGVAGDLQSAAASFQAAESSLRDAGGLLGGLGRLGWAVPGLAQQLQVADTAVDAAGDAAEAGRRAGRSIDLDDIAVAAGGIDLAAVTDTEPALAQLSDALRSAVDRLRTLDRSLLAGPLSDALDDALDDAGEAGTTADRLQRAVDVAPDLLGAGGPRRYLLLFTTPDEARGRIGFPGGYAVVRLDDGRFVFEGAGSTSDIDEPMADVPADLQVPPRAVPYLGYQVTQYWRDLSIPPDAPTAAALARQFAAATPEIGPVDGVVFADPHALAALVGLLGSIDVPGIGELTQETTVDFVVRDQYLRFPELGERRDRKDLLSVIAEEVGLRLQGLSLPSVRSFTDAFGPVVADGHLMVTLDPVAEPAASALLAETGVDGGFPGVGSGSDDIVHVAQIDNGASKIDLFLERHLDYAVEIDELGQLEARLRLELTNTAPASGLPWYLIGSVVDPDERQLGTNFGTTFLYSRHELGDLTIDGVPVLPSIGYDDGLFVYQVRVDLGPGQTRVVEASFTGRSPAAEHRVRVIPGGLVVPDEVSISIDDARQGRSSTDTFTLDRPRCLAATAERRPCA